MTVGLSTQASQLIRHLETQAPAVMNWAQTLGDRRANNRVK